MGPDKVSVYLPALHNILFFTVCTQPIHFQCCHQQCVFCAMPQGVRNDPTNVVRGVAAIASQRGISVEETRVAIRENFQRLFNL